MVVRESNIMSNKPKEFEYELANSNHMNGWGKRLDGLPQFSVQNMQNYAHGVIVALLIKFKIVKKAFY